MYQNLVSIVVLCLFMSFNSNTMGVTCGVGTTNPSGAPEFIHCF